MFGYVRPLKGSLRVVEYERFRAVYCGLCRTLSTRYSPAASMLLNYDLAFFAAAAEGLMSSDAGAPRTAYTHRRCVAHPLHKRCFACAEDGDSTPALELAADLTVILSCFKLRDKAADDGALARVGAGISLAALSGFEKKAKSLRPELYADVKGLLERLGELEHEKCDSLDMCADCFANILRAAGKCADDGESFGDLLYHVGRWIYIIDAYDDLERDLKSGAFNAVAERYSVTAENLDEKRKSEIRASIEHTLALSLDAAYAAYKRLDFGEQSGFVLNVITSGLDMVSRAVADGTWRLTPREKRRITNDRPL